MKSFLRKILFSRQRMLARSSLLGGAVFLACLLVIWPLEIRRAIRDGVNYQSIVVTVSGLDSNTLREISIETRSPLGSRGQLQPSDEPGVFATAFDSQPLSELFLHVPETFSATPLQVSLYFGVPLPVKGDWRSSRVSQTLTNVQAEVTAGEAERVVNLHFQPLSGYSWSPWGRALNWSGDVRLVLRTLVRSIGLALGVLLLLGGIRAFVREIRGVSDQVTGLMADQVAQGSKSSSGKWLLQWCALIAVIAGILFLRDPRVLLSPSMELEDGTMIFQHFYQHRGASELLRFKAGYVPLIPNILGYLSVRVPTTLAAHWLAGVPFLVSVFFYGLLFCRAYAGLFPGRGSAAASCLLLALAPVSDRLLLANTDYMIWNLLGLLLLLSVVDPGRGFASCTLCMFGMPLLICSHPLSILVGPVLAFRWGVERRLRSYWLVGLGVIILYQLLGVQHHQVPQGDSLIGKLLQVRDVGLLAVQFSGQLGVRSLLGRVWTESLSPELLQLLSWGMVLVFSVVLVTALIRRTRCWKELLLGLYFVYGLTFLCLYARGAESIQDFDGAPRYIYVQSLIFLTVCASGLSSITAGLLVNKSSKESITWKTPGLAIWMLIMVWNWYLNVQLGCFGGTAGKHTPYLVQHPENGATVSRFLKELATLETVPRSESGFRLEAVKQGDWTITIDTRSEKNDTIK